MEISIPSYGVRTESSSSSSSSTSSWISSSSSSSSSPLGGQADLFFFRLAGLFMALSLLEEKERFRGFRADDSDPSSSSSPSHFLLFFLSSSGEVHDTSVDSITIPLVPLGPFGTPFLPATCSAASCIARRTASRAVPSPPVTVFALMTAHYRPHRSLWGSSCRI